MNDFIPLVDAARQGYRRPPVAVPASPLVNFKSVAVFCAEYQPLSYAIEGIVRSASLYSLTASTGSGKTAFLISTALAVVTGRPDILGCEVTRGRVAYIACENPDDIRMRFMIAAFLFNIDLHEIADRLQILDVRAKPEEILSALEVLGRTGPFSVIAIDTLAAFFDGDNINDAVQGGEFMRRLRPFTRIDGLPSVVVAAHPVKNAPEDRLVPYGSGAILNEVDGNLCLSKNSETGIVSLHWQGKLRGLEFPPRPFRFDTCGSPDVLDDKGRQVVLPILRPSTDEVVAEREDAEASTDMALLRAMLAEPNGRGEDWGAAIGRAKSRVSGRLQRLAGERVVEKVMGKWQLTAKGKKVLESR